MTNRTRWLAIGATAFAVVLGAGAALAASGSNDPASSFLGDVAKRLGISESKLTDAIKDAEIARIDAAQARGDLTKEQADALKERVRSGDAPALLPGLRGHGRGLGLGPLGLGPPGHAFGHRGFGFGLDKGANVLQAAADYLGVTNRELLESLGNGKSLSDLAKEKGKSLDGLKDAVKKAIRADVDKAVKDGALTKEQGDKLYSALAAGADKLVEGGFGLHLKLRGGHDGFKFEFKLDDDGPGAGLDRAPEPEQEQAGVFF